MKKIGCDCVRKLEIGMRKKFGPDAELTSDATMTRWSGNFSKVEGTFRIPAKINFRYRKKRKDGKLSSIWVSGFFGADFCSLCGKRYDSRKAQL